MADPTYNLNGGYKPTLKRFADLDGPDFFPTPRWATFALIDNEKFNGDIWECACGDGAMSRVLEQTGSARFRALTFMNADMAKPVTIFWCQRDRQTNIVTNPPYNCAEGFVANGIKQARRKFALGIGLAFLEGANRANTIFARTPPSRVWVFSERITFYPTGVQI